MRVLVTGAEGFVGRHLCAHLRANPAVEVVGTALDHVPAGRGGAARQRIVRIDLRDAGAVRELVADARPDHVYHLAAQSSVPASYADPWDTIENNVRSQLNLLEALREAFPAARVLIVGSNEEYGSPVEGALPFTEESPLRPSSPYAVSKVAQDLLGLQYYLAHRMPIIRARPFNHTGPGQSDRFAIPSFARQIATAEAGLQKPVIQVGNLEARRDFCDVRDIVRGYAMLLAAGAPGEAYNLASGRSRSVGSVLEVLLSYSSVAVRVTVDPARCRPVDVPEVYGSAAKMRRLTGWDVRVPFEKTLLDTLGYWREKLGP